MKIHSVYDPEFRPYGRVLPGYDTNAFCQLMKTIPMPESGVSYLPDIVALEASYIFPQFRDRAYGGMPIQAGMCWGYNTKMNCLEYHRDSELNIGSDDYILLLAKQEEIENGSLDTGKVKAFWAPAGSVVEVFATTLHYAPCQTRDSGFRVAVILPRGTNTEPPVIKDPRGEDAWMTAKNKWLLAHPESQEAKNGAHIGLTGINPDLH